MSKQLYILSDEVEGGIVGTLDEVFEWAIDRNVPLDNLYLCGEKIDVKALIKEKYGE